MYVIQVRNSLGQGKWKTVSGAAIRDHVTALRLADDMARDLGKPCKAVLKPRRARGG